MLENIFKFQHTSDDIPTALGLPVDIDKKCREIIHFSVFTNYFIKKEFFENDDETPENLTTITGMLEKSLSLCKTDQERVYTLFIFRNIHKNCSQAIGAWETLDEEKDEKAKKKLQMLLELVELKALSEEEDRANLLTPKDMFKKIEAARNNMYNFDKYYNVINEQN